MKWRTANNRRRNARRRPRVRLYRRWLDLASYDAKSNTIKANIIDAWGATLEHRMYGCSCPEATEDYFRYGAHRCFLGTGGKPSRRIDPNDWYAAPPLAQAID